MQKPTVQCVLRSEALRYAANCLADAGICVTEKAAPDVTHLLLPVPSFTAGDAYCTHILSDLPEDVIIAGGNLNSPLLQKYQTVDFLQDPYYTARNAAITADCTIEIIENNLGHPPAGLQVLILGWGRIGKCLGKKLQQAGGIVTVAARKVQDLAILQALGYRSVSTEIIAAETKDYDVIINTVPVLLLQNPNTKPNAILLELASRPGMTGDHIIDARGLPSKMAPAQSGKLIAETLIRLTL